MSRKINKKLLNVSMTALLIIFSGRTLKRNADWRDEESLYRSGIPVNPAKGKGK